MDVSPGRDRGTLLYFVSPLPGRRLMPVVRPAEVTVRTPPDGTGTEQAWNVPDKAMAMLLAGPDETEARAGLRTELPRGDIRPSLSPGPDGVAVRLNALVTKLSDIARQQLICTAASARAPDRFASVRLMGTDGALAPDRCSV
ncbi:hypothetical protein [Streptomyces sp. NPDC056061]|uniref:hypothetical protein n=1 Tax=Streptomyces sp. NPDC056061 TaxID=3345700 RepID=UPI0035E3BAD8